MALTQIDDRGLKTPIDLLDTEKIRLGTGNDLELYHDTENYIKSATASVNLILESAHDVYIKHGGENMLKCTGDGAVDLYHDNSLKFETTSSGTRTTGAMHINDGAADSNRISVGNGGDLKIFHTNPTTFIQDSSTALVINSARLDINNAADNEQMARFNQDGAVELYHNNIKKFDTITTGIRVHGDEGGTAQIHFAADEGDDNPDYWRIIGETSGPILNFQSYNSGNWTNNLRMTGDQGCELYYNNGVKFQTTSAGATVTGDLTTGQLFIGDGGPGATDDNICVGDGKDLKIYHDGNSTLYDNGAGNFKLYSNGGAIELQKDTGENMGVFNTDGSVELYYDNTKRLETTATGVKQLGGFQVLDSAESEWIAYGNANGECALYYDGSEKFRTTSTGIQTAEVVHMKHGTNGVNIRQVYENGIGNTASCTATVPSCVGGGTVTVTCMHNGNTSITTTKMYPIMIQGTSTVTLGSEIFSINALTAASFSVSAAAQGVTVTNNAGAHAKIRVTFDITANA